ncbi:hypothetical protein RF11_11977 [Thelohanellus kitauei]|uniref:Thioredoxin domain-containing protein n=1 Tax=Thelohanellus kitauei TaxID=669202 RepID=A0A0C2MP84_THEKT|nr:hypothetical protein RF11_11977 [Thelohanellus kitauei]
MNLGDELSNLARSLNIPVSLENVNIGSSPSVVPASILPIFPNLPGVIPKPPSPSKPENNRELKKAIDNLNNSLQDVNSTLAKLNSFLMYINNITVTLDHDMDSFKLVVPEIRNVAKTVSTLLPDIKNAMINVMTILMPLNNALSSLMTILPGLSAKMDEFSNLSTSINQNTDEVGKGIGKIVQVVPNLNDVLGNLNTSVTKINQLIQNQSYNFIVIKNSNQLKRENNANSGLVVIEVLSSDPRDNKRLQSLLDDIHSTFINVKFLRIFGDETPGLMNELLVASIPIIIVYRNGLKLESISDRFEKQLLPMISRYA